MRIWHHKILGAGSYPLEIRLKGGGILVPQCLTIHIIRHPSSSDEPLSKSLCIIVEVKNQVRNQHVMRAVIGGSGTDCLTMVREMLRKQESPPSFIFSKWKGQKHRKIPLKRLLSVWEVGYRKGRC